MTGAQRFLLAVFLAAGAVQPAVVRWRHDLASNRVTAITGVAVDTAGFIYEVGTTAWPGFPTTPGPFSRFSGSRGSTSLTSDVFVRKLSPDGQQVIFSALIGGSGDETSTGIAVDAQGNIFVTGYTDSADFPVTAPSQHTPKDAFVFEMDRTGMRLVFSRLIGGNGNDMATGIALAPDGRVVIAGTTHATDFPTTPNALQGANAASENPSRASAFIVRLAGGSIDYGTYLGGPGGASGEDVAVDLAGDIYVAGFAGAFFPTLQTSFAPQAPFGGFVSKLDHITGRLVYSTYLPGVTTPFVGPFARLVIRVDANRHAYVAGPAAAGFPATAGAFQTDIASDPFVRYPTADAFVLELDESGARLVFATLFGGAGNDHALGLSLTGDSITIAGATSSPFLPLRDFGLPVCNLLSLHYSIGEPYTTFAARFDHSGKLVTSFGFGACLEERPTALTQGPSGLLMAGTYLELQSSFLMSIDMNATAPVQVAAVTDAASLQVGQYALLEIVTIFGSGLGPARGVNATPAGGAFPTVLAGTRVFIGGVPAPLLSVRDGQINAVVPQGASFPRASITVSTSAGTSAPITTLMEHATPALFTINGSGTGPGAILNQDNTVNSARNVAARGSTIVLFGTGGGLTDPPFADGQIVPTAAQIVSAQYLAVTFGNKVGRVLYAGAAPGQINGLLQVNVTIPDDAPTGPAVPVAIHLYPYRSQSGVTVAIR